ncbi:heme biosynthesis HemY N-terminal domain-containing protein [Shewanella sp. GXUN23E]|uniref:heme biosynthesis HemY N-terminal domain-containing protein n=1 Tax=Shewanella sp. GXUN23E TaxID=3422498 RepID=UPI003D7F1573
MIRALAFLIIILAGLCLSPWLVGNTGYVYVAAGDYQAETSVVFAIMLLLVAFGLIQVVEWLLIKLLTLIFNSRLLPERWRRNAARKHTLNGALALAEENWSGAEQAMAKGAKKGELPALNLLAAARAAQHQQHYEQRDAYLAEAENYPQAQQAVQTSRVRYLMQQQAWELAAAELEKLHPGPRSSQPILRLAVELYRHEQNWGALLKLMPTLEKKQVLNASTLSRLNHEIHLSHLSVAGDAGLPQLELAWGDLPRQSQQDPELLAIYCRGLMRFNQTDKAIKLILKALKKQFQPQLALVLAEWAPSDNHAAIKALTDMASTQENNAAYQEAMARLNQRQREFKQARIHWQKVCELSPSRNAWLALGELQQQLGDNSGALHSFHQAAKL